MVIKRPRVAPTRAVLLSAVQGDSSSGALVQVLWRLSEMLPLQSTPCRWTISPDPTLKGTAMYSRADVPEAYRQFFFVNAGGPSRKVLSREMVQKKWQLVTLDCSHRMLMPKYQKSANVGCGFCGGLDPMTHE
jgi:hypothetical protein